MTEPEVAPGSLVEARHRQIEALTDSTLAHLSFEDLLVELLDRTREILDTDTAAILLFDDTATHLVAIAARGIEEEVRQGVRIPVGQGFAGRIAAEMAPVAIDRVDHTNVLNPILREKGIRSLLGVPLISGGRVLGVLHVGTQHERHFTGEDAELLQVVGDRVALVTQASMSAVERSAAVALQRSIMPTWLPDLAGIELSARYVPGEAGGVGGDWYDVFSLPSGWVCVSVGDVAGRGLRAAVVMGRLRSALRAYALETRDPAEVLARLDRKLAHFEPGELATALCAMVDPSLERVHVSSAGHLPPVIARPDRPTALLDVPTDPPIGVNFVARRRSAVVDLPVDAVVCFYTDGLVERRGESIDEGLERMRSILVAGQPADAVAVTVMKEALGGDPHADDVALLVLRRRSEEEASPLELSVPSEPSSLGEVRVAVRRWLSGIGATDTETADLVVAIGEACSNAIEHAYGPVGGRVVIRLEHTPPDVTATVRDTGNWRPPRGANRGRGLAIMRAVSDAADVDHRADGTTVTIRKTIGRGPRT